MILTTAALLVGAGIILFVGGYVLGRPEVAMFGAIIVIAAGAAGVSAGYQVKVGETENTALINTSVAVDDIGESGLDATKDVSTEDGSPTGIDFSGDGRHMFIAGADTASVYAYDSGDHSLTIATHRGSFDVSPWDGVPTSVEMGPDGKDMYVTGGSSNTLYWFKLSEPYNVTTASHRANLSLGSELGDPRASVLSKDGLKLYIADAGGSIYEYSLTEAFNITTAVREEEYDVSDQEGTPTGLDFGNDGTRMLLVGEEQDTIFQYELGAAYEIGSAAYARQYLDLSGETNRPSAVGYEDEGRKIFASDRQGGDALQYDSSETRSQEETTTRNVYEDVRLPAGFPLGAVVLLLGMVMLMSSATEAGEEGHKEMKRIREED